MTLLGGLVLIAGVGSAVYLPALAPDLPNGVALGASVGLTSLGLVVAILGCTRPDPRETTVRGLFGNAWEEELERRLRAQRTIPRNVRYRPSPRESVDCPKCRSVMPAQVLECPRCGLRRRCQNCGKPLFRLAGAIRCAPCTKDEVYCDCPRAPTGASSGTAGPSSARW